MTNEEQVIEELKVKVYAITLLNSLNRKFQEDKNLLDLDMDSWCPIVLHEQVFLTAFLFCALQENITSLAMVRDGCPIKLQEFVFFNAIQDSDLQKNKVAVAMVMDVCPIELRESVSTNVTDYCQKQVPKIRRSEKSENLNAMTEKLHQSEPLESMKSPVNEDLRSSENVYKKNASKKIPFEKTRLTI